MPRVRQGEISPKKRAIIVTLAKEGYSIRQISAKVNIPKSTVADVRSRWIANPTGFGTPKKRSGRPRKTDARFDRQIERKCMENRFHSSKTIRNSLGEVGNQISDRTVRRRLQQAGFHARRPARKPFVNYFQRRRRVIFAKKYSEKPLEYWKRTIFSDESSFDLFGNRGSVKVWRRPGERFLPNCMLPTFKHPESVMVWGCFSNEGVGRLRILAKSQKVNQHVYMDILNKELRQTQRDQFPNGGSIFQDDNAPCHRARTVQEWFRNHSVQHIDDWPGQSPDMNPIENLWAVVGHVIRDRAPTCRSEIIASIVHAWYRVITRETCQKLAQSVPNRLKNTIKSKGFPSRY